MNNKHAPECPAWLDQARQLLDQSTRDLDATTLSRLNRARQTALQLRTSRTSRLWWIPTGVASTCALLIAFAAWHPPMTTHNVAPQSEDNTTNVAMIENGDSDAEASPEFYQDLDFYAWLDAQGEDSGG